MGDIPLDEKALEHESRLIEAGKREAAELCGPGTVTKPVSDAVDGYEIIDEIGRGGMGIVYRALQLSTKRVVALKVMLAGQFASHGARERFQREVELAARFQHAGIVRVLESGLTGGGLPYYAMDYVEGAPLDHWLAVSQPDTKTILRLFQEICDAVGQAHRLGVVHRDLKPANVLIDTDGKPRILDFGLSKAMRSDGAGGGPAVTLSLPGQVVGTLQYLSPEQAAGALDEIDPRTDVYAVGVILYEALTGGFPYDTAGSPSDVMLRIRENPPVPPSSLSKHVDRELETIILKALEKEKARRYQSVMEFGKDLGRYLRDEPILARRPSSFYLLRKQVARQKVRIAFAALVVMLSLAGLWGGNWWLTRSQEHRLERDRAKARQTLLKVQSDLEAGRTGACLGEAQSVRSQYPDLPEARLVLAQAQFWTLGYRQNAIIGLEDELEQNPSRSGCAALLSEIHRHVGNTTAADELKPQAESDTPDTAEAWYVRSFATLEKEKALRCAEEAVLRDDTHVLAWQRLTKLYLLIGELDGAARGAERLIELEQDPVDWMIRLGDILVRKGESGRAIEQYDEAIRRGGRRGEAYRQRAHAYRQLGEYEQAVADYAKALKLLRGSGGEDPIWVRYQRATVLWILGRTGEAIGDYDCVRSYLGRAFYGDARSYIILRDEGRQYEADEIVDSALQAVGDDRWMAKIFACLKGQVAPGELIEDALGRENREHHCEAYYYAGEVYRLSGKTEKAQECFEKAVQTGVEYDLDALQPMNEYELARWRLRQLTAARNASSHPEEE